MRIRLTLTLVACLAAAPALAGQSKTAPDDRFQAAMGLARLKRDGGDVKAARRYFEEARALRAFDASQLAEYFWVLAGQDAAAAVGIGREVLGLVPDNRAVRDRMITETLTLGDEAGVVRLAEEGQRRDGRTALWPRRLGESLLRQHQPASAADAFAQAVRQPDATNQDRVALAVALEGAGRYSDSVEAWNAVPASDRRTPDLERSRLRALGQGGNPSAGSELDAWLATNPGDRDIRALAVEVWVRAGQPDKALAALEPLTTGSDADGWIRRKIAIAQAAGKRDVAIATMEKLVSRRGSNPADRAALAALLIEAGQVDRATALLRGTATASDRCDTRTLELIDRVPGETGTKLLVEAVRLPKCSTASAWIRRAIDRSVASSDHRTALELIARLPPAMAATPEVRRLTGQLELWTGNPAAAITRLEGVISADPNDIAGREALIDAYRATRRPAEAWRVAQPLSSRNDLTPDRRVILAELALEVDRPEEVARLIGALDNVPAPVRAGLLGRALLAGGQPREALTALSNLPTDRMPAPVALAFVDATLAASGKQAAAQAARVFKGQSAEWRDLIARRVVLEAITGHAPEEHEALRATLARIDPQAVTIADIEVALGMGRPHEALSLITTLPNDPQSERVADLEAISHEAAGDTAGALTVVRRLRLQRPDSVSLRLREAVLQYQLTPTQALLTSILQIHTGFPANQNAAIAAARALAGAGRRTEALTALGAQSSWSSLPAEGRLVAAQCLQAEGRVREALAVLPEAGESNAVMLELRAELMGAIDGPAAAARALSEASQRGPGTPQLFLKWADVAATPVERASILTDGTKRFPADVALQTKLAAAEWAAGRPFEARRAATRAVELDAHAAEAWFVLLDAAAVAGSSAEFDAVLKRFESSAADQPGLVISIAERLAAFVRQHDDPLIARALGWLDATVPANPGMGISRDIARARVFAAAERWQESLGAIDKALAADVTSPVALKLRAELLSWSGQHAEAVRAYDRYFARQPQDIEAWRQQARVAGWGGAFGQARQLYAALETRVPGDARVAAEAAAKTAYFDGRWQAAADAYARWVALEPGNGEARFELAESLRAAGHVADANRALRALNTTTRHRLAGVALDRARVTRATSMDVIADHRSADGYGGQKLLDFHQYGGALRTTFSKDAGVRVALESTRVEASAGDRLQRGYRAGITSAMSLSSSVSLHGQAMLWDVASPTGTTTDLAFDATWRAADRWTIGAGMDRAPIFENLDTINAGLAATGGFGQVAFESPRTSFQGRISQQSLSDGNARRRATISGTQALGDHLKQVRLIGWAESLAYRTASPAYFSPDHQFRADAGVQYAHSFFTPRFRSDRQQMFAVSYLIGIDDRGTTYHHPMLQLSLEFANGLTFDTRASWIRSDVYRETTAFVGITVRPGARVR